MQDKKTQPQQPTQNIQMMRAESCEEYHTINIVTCNGMAISEDKGKELETEEWVCKVIDKEVRFELNHAKETFIEAKNNFAATSTFGSKINQPGTMKYKMWFLQC